MDLYLHVCERNDDWLEGAPNLGLFVGNYTYSRDEMERLKTYPGMEKVLFEWNKSGLTWGQVEQISEKFMCLLSEMCKKGEFDRSRLENYLMFFLGFLSIRNPYVATLLKQEK